jgi:predicted nucleic acid-binding protein
VSQRVPRAVISVVTKGELKALAYKFQWGPDKHGQLDATLASLPAVDISPRPLYEAYARLDFASASRGFKLGKNDLWIAATAVVTGGVLLTTDGDFEPLATELRVERVHEAELR